MCRKLIDRGLREVLERRDVPGPARRRAGSPLAEFPAAMLLVMIGGTATQDRRCRSRCRPQMSK